MLLADVLAVLDALDDAEVRWWVAGGWGVDALVGHQTRDHRDLDLLVDAQQMDLTLTGLARLGYAVETDWLPIRVELAAETGWVDVHPVRFDATGHGVQAGPDGSRYDYPPDVFTTGTLGGRQVPCFTVAFQRVAHSGYPPRAQDTHDLRLLDELSRTGQV